MVRGHVTYEGAWLLQFLEGMSEKIKKGIEAAQTDIIKEKEQKEQEEVHTL